VLQTADMGSACLDSLFHVAVGNLAYNAG
jgi:hypothetical protein